MAIFLPSELEIMADRRAIASLTAGVPRDCVLS